MKVLAGDKRRSNEKDEERKKLESTIQKDFEAKQKKLNSEILETAHKLQTEKILRDEKTVPPLCNKLECLYQEKFFLLSTLRAPAERARAELAEINRPYVEGWVNQLRAEIQGLNTHRAYEVTERFKREPMSKFIDEPIKIVKIKHNFRSIDELIPKIIESITVIQKSCDCSSLEELEGVYNQALELIPESGFPLKGEMELSEDSLQEIKQTIDSHKIRAPEIDLRTAFLASDLRKHEEWLIELNKKYKPEGSNKPAGFRY